MSTTPATEMTYRQIVSGNDRTLQAYDFLCQTMNLMLQDEEVDTVLLCELVKTYAIHSQFPVIKMDTELAQSPEDSRG